MANFSADLGPRVISAAIMLPLAILDFWIGGLAFQLLVLAIALLAIIEWQNLIGGARFDLRWLLSVIGIAVVIACAKVAGLGFAFMLLAAIAVGLYFVERSVPGSGHWSLLGLCWLAIPMLVFLWLRAQPEIGFAVIIWVCALVWASDIGAYFAGRAIGGPKLAPRFSPKKTWAGLIGGALAAALAGALTAIFFDNGDSLGWIALVSILLAIVSQIGDICESAVKRHFGVKDSGQLIPGHGGILDRIDALLFAVAMLGVLSLLNQGTVPLWQ